MSFYEDFISSFLIYAISAFKSWQNLKKLQRNKIFYLNYNHFSFISPILCILWPFHPFIHVLTNVLKPLLCNQMTFLIIFSQPAYFGGNNSKCNSQWFSIQYGQGYTIIHSRHDEWYRWPMSSIIYIYTCTKSDHNHRNIHSTQLIRLFQDVRLRWIRGRLLRNYFRKCNVL